MSGNSSLSEPAELRGETAIALKRIHLSQGTILVDEIIGYTASQADNKIVFPGSALPH